MQEYLHKSNGEAVPEINIKEGLLTEMRLTVRAIMSAIHQFTGITPMRLLVFQLLEGGKELSQADIQHRLGVDAALITRLVKQMEAEGVLTRRPDPADNRFTLVRLTQKAQEMIEEKMSRRRELEPTLFEGLSDDEIAAMRQFMKRIRGNAESILAPDSKNHTALTEGDPVIGNDL